MALRHKLRASDAVARAAAAEVGEERAARARDDDAARTPLGDANARRREEKPTRGGAEAEAPPRGATPMASDAKRKKSKKEKETAAPPILVGSAKAERASPRSSPRRAAAAVTAAATKDATPPKPAASPAAPHSAPIAGLSPVAAAPGKSPVRSSPRLRAAALAAETAAAPKTSPGATASADFQFAAVGASARRAPARGAATKTPSRLGKASKDAAAREATATATATSLGARVSTDDASRETRAGARMKANARDENDQKTLPTKTHVNTPPDQNSQDQSLSGGVGVTLGLRPRRGGLTIGGARRVLVETNDAYDAAEDFAEDVPTLAGPDPDLETDTLVDRAEPKSVTVPDARSTGKSSVKSSRNPGAYGARDELELVSAERKITGMEERGDFSLSAAGRSTRARSAHLKKCRAPRPPPPKDLTVPVSPAITKARKSGSKRKNEVLSSEELDLERSLAAAAKEKAKRRRVEDRAGDGAAGRGSTRVVATGVGRSTRATAKKKTRAARVAFGGRVVGGSSAKKEENGRDGSASAPRPRGVPTVPTVPRSPNLRGASLRDRFGKTSAKTSEELELERLAAVPRFKARPLKRGVLQGSAGAAEKAAAAAAKRREAAADAARVKPAPFDAAVGRARTRDERAAERAELAARDAKRARAAADAEPFGFAGAVPPTAPESPAFATARRAALRAPHEPHPFSSLTLAVGPAAATRGARRVAASDVDEPLSSSTNFSNSDAFGRVDGVTCPAPFALATDRRGEAARADLEFRLEQKARLEAERARVAAAARPVPKTSSSRRRSRLPEPVFKPPTVAEPFRLRGEALSAYEKQREEKALRKEEEEETRRRRFVAAPLPESTFRASFVAKKSDAPLTTPAVDTITAGARRAVERAAFDAEIGILKRRQEEAKEETRRLEEKEEAKARAAFRRSARFEAAPMPDYDALASLGVAPVAERALTRPESPPLRTNRRASRWG